MTSLRAVSIIATCVIVAAVASAALGDREQAGLPARNAAGAVQSDAPFVISQQGPVTWVQTHTDFSRCPGDPGGGHGGEATGGPDGSETWCVEAGVGDSCGTNPPWTTDCFTYLDIRAMPSPANFNYWHIDSYRTNQRAYTGALALWCGYDWTWPGRSVECDARGNPPGYGNYWNCIVQLSLPADFSVAGGCTLYFDPRYDIECCYDLFYVEYWNGTRWERLATFNATSDNPNPYCRPYERISPDFFHNSNYGMLINCNWQQRATPNEPAFKGVIAPGDLHVTNMPKFRWRLASDEERSDVDGRLDTDGGAFLDNVIVCGDNPPGPGNAMSYAQNFEACSAYGPLPDYWTLENPTPFAQGWHIKHDADPPFEGGDGGSPTTCFLDSSWTWRARPEKGFPTGVPWRDGWAYRLVAPRVPIGNTGCVVQYDQYMCIVENTCDYTDTQVRFHDGVEGVWCPWMNIDGLVVRGECDLWHLDFEEDVSMLYGPDADSMQFGWDFGNGHRPVGSGYCYGLNCFGKHQKSDNLIDNVSIGFYSRYATQFSTRGVDLLHDSFLEEVSQAYNSFFDTYSSDSIAKYSSPSPPPLPKNQQLYVDCSDKDGLAAVQVLASINQGSTWVTRPMTLAAPHVPGYPGLGGEYYGTVKAQDFNPGDTAWVLGTEAWYYVKATDNLDNVGYFPARADPAHPDHDGTRDDYFSFSILPAFPPTYEGPKILLVNGDGRSADDWSPCLTSLSQQSPLDRIYEQTLTDAGYRFDKFDIGGAGNIQHIHPIQFSYYDAVVWFTGPSFARYLFDAEAQDALQNYLADGGKVVLCGDRIAYSLAVLGEDHLGGEFLSCIMGATYEQEMGPPLQYPFVRMEAASTVSVFGSPVPIQLDSLLVYRGYWDPKDMSCVLTNIGPPAGCTAQQLLEILNPHECMAADGAIYTEYQAAGQCVYVNFDLCAAVNHKATSCSGVTPDPAPDFAAGYYYGRVDLMYMILHDLFGLDSEQSGAPQVPNQGASFRWDLCQNRPNPLVSGTEIAFEVGCGGAVSIKVYNAAGQMVKVLKNERMLPGRYCVGWDGTNQNNERVSGGVYFCAMEGEDYSATKKMVVVK